MNCLDSKISQVASDISELKRGIAALSDRVPDQSDAGSVLEATTSLQVQLKAKEKLHLGLIKAIAKQRNGTYGLCDECGIEIPIARLNLVPEASHCVDCQQINEHKRSAA